MLAFLIFAQCIDPYRISSIDYAKVLVIEGVISTEFKQHVVKISNTSQLAKAEFLPETNAIVTIRSNAGTIPLIESGLGIYQTPPLQGKVGNRYQLLIETSNGKKYMSDQVVLKDNPGIAALYTRFSKGLPALGGKDGFEILLDTGDSTKTVRYYRWEAEETWEIRTPFESNFVWLGGNTVVFRTVPVSVCFITDSVGSVITNTSLGLSTDKIKRQLIQAIPADSRKMQVLYSINVRQFVVTPKAYLYWEAIRKVNQTQGGLYDTQPGVLQGNITRQDGAPETVLGFFDACEVREKRIFVRPLEYRSAGFVPIAFGDHCRFLQQVPVPRDNIGEFYQDASRSNLRILGSSQGILYLLPKECCECTSIDDAKTDRPIFWP